MLDDLNIQIVTPIRERAECTRILAQLERLKDYKWLAYEEQAKSLMQQQRDLADIAKTRMEEAALAEDKRLNILRLEREAEIAKNAAAQATKETEARIKKEQEEKKRGEQAKVNAEQRSEEARNVFVPEEERKLNSVITVSCPDKEDVEHQRKIHNEILNALLKLPSPLEQGMVDVKVIIKAIANNRIPHLTINY